MQLLQRFHELTLHPKNSQYLKDLILQLAVQGKLTVQWRKENHNVQPATVLLHKINSERTQLIKDKIIKNGKEIPKIEENEKYFQLPQSWEWSRLVEVGNIYNGDSINASQKIAKYEGLTEGYPYIATKDVGYGFERINHETGVRIPFEGPKFKIAHKGTVLICSEGGSAGKKTGIVEEDVCFGNKLYAFEQFGQIESIYILSLYQCPAFKTEFENRMSGIIGGISASNFSNIPIPIPPLEEQKAIVSIVLQLFKEVEQLEALTKDRIRLKEDFVISALQQMGNGDSQKEWAFIKENFHNFFNETSNIKKLREALLKIAIQGSIMEKSCANDNPLKVLERIKNERISICKNQKELNNINELFDSPNQYEIKCNVLWIRAELICDFITKGTTPNSQDLLDLGEVPFLKVYNIVKNKINFEYKPQYVSNDIHQGLLKRSQLFPGDVLMNIVGPPLCKVAIIPNNYPQWNMNQALAVFRPIKNVNNQYLYWVLSEGSAIRKVATVGTAGQDNISLTQSRDLLIPVPEIKTQNVIIENVNRLMTLCDQLEIEVQNSKIQTELLMKSALREVFVEQDV